MKKDFVVISWFLKQFKLQVFLIFLFLFVFSLLETASIGAFYPLLNSLLGKGDEASSYSGKALEFLDSLTRLVPIEEKIVASSVFLLILMVVKTLFGLFSNGVATWYRYKFFALFLDKVFAKIMNNHYRYFHEKKQGDLLYIGMNASQAVGEMLHYFPKVGIEVFRILAISSLLLTISVKVTFLLFAIVALFGFVIHFLSTKVIYPIAVSLQEAQSELTSVFSESIAAVKEIKIYDSFSFWYKRFAQTTHDTRMLSTKNVLIGTLPNSLMELLGAASIVGIIIVIKVYVPEQFNALLPVIAVYVFALQRLMPAVSNIGNHWMGLKGLAPRLLTTYETLIDQSYRVPEGKDEFRGLQGELHIKDVSFSYSAQKDVLKNIGIVIRKNQTVALVGESGSGKSTVANLLTRLYEPKAGEILADGTNVMDFTPSSWLRNIGMVSQDSFIFHASVKDNILIGKPDATDEEMVSAARIANAHDFIVELEKGYDTVLGDRGLKLSGGQKQRIAIARAIVRNPGILILDEATSALDNISEKLVQEALERAEKDRTNIVIAHRLTTIRHADKIFVMKKGQVVEEGTHDELLALQGYYHSLYETQKRTH